MRLRVPIDVDRNAFWASAASLLPRDIFKSRGGRAAMRILGVSYSVVKQAATYRGEMEDRHGGWRLLKTRPHSRFVRQGDHLVCSHDVSLYEALTGARARGVAGACGERLPTRTDLPARAQASAAQCAIWTGARCT